VVINTPGSGWKRRSACYITTASTLRSRYWGSEADPNDETRLHSTAAHVRSAQGRINSWDLNPQDVVSLTGKDPNGGWLQIEFAAGPEGKGWVNAAFVQAQGVENLPIITEAGQIVGTGTPTTVPATPTATLVPAREDNDSPISPVASVIFEPAGTQMFIYNGDISSPQGDPRMDFSAYSSLFAAWNEGSDSSK
jgi:hypothetical protein